MAKKKRTDKTLTRLKIEKKLLTKLINKKEFKAVAKLLNKELGIIEGQLNKNHNSYYHESYYKKKTPIDSLGFYLDSTLRKLKLKN